jgi:hypothetical protein
VKIFTIGFTNKKAEEFFDPAASVDHRSFGLDQTCLRRNRSDE